MDVPPAPKVASDEAVIAFCGACHGLVPHESVPTERWEGVIERMVTLSRQFRPELSRPPMEALLAYHVQRSKPALDYPAPPQSAGPIDFERRAEAIAPHVRAAGAMHLSAGEAAGKNALRLWINDTIHGEVLEYRGATNRYRSLAKLRQPARMVRADLDADGLEDAVVADLGSYFDGPDVRGDVVWLRQGPVGRFEAVHLLRDVGRVADVAAGDVDGDGDLDVVAGMFGWVDPGVFLLRNQGPGRNGRPRFAPERLDDRKGCVDVEIDDLDGDGRAEVLAVLSEEHEVVVSYRQGSGGGFEPHVVAAAGDPGHGSSGLTPTDIDGDGDRDLLWVNGDVVDSAVVRPRHGVRLIENRGSEGFAVRQLAFMPGAHRAKVADLDGDGDLDVAVASFLPSEQLLGRKVLGPARSPSVAWLEQTPGARFQLHALEWDRPVHTDVEIADADGDGDLDILVPELNPAEVVDRGKVVGLPVREAPFSLWENRGRRPAATASPTQGRSPPAP